MDSETREISAAAFMRRPTDIDGLSVNPASTCSVDFVRNRLRKCYGVVSLHVGRLRDIELDVVQDGLEHANIIGVPYSEENSREAERLAGMLARQSRLQRALND